jgi:L-threonylcarbamoyladenylate synthase
MITKLLDASEPGAIEQAAELIKRGLLVAFPTDTLYGVGAYVHDPEALELLYRAKNRSRDKGIPVLLADRDDLLNLVTDVPAAAEALTKEYWPGPLTLIFSKRSNLPDVLSPNRGIAVRVPDNPIARQLIRYAGGAVATSSANKSGAPAAHTAEQARMALRDSIAAVLDGGPVRLGVASTIVDFTTKHPTLVREGPIPLTDLGLEEMKPA